MELKQGIKADTDKIPLDLLPFDGLEEVAKVLKHGADKYERRNWEKGIKWTRLSAAATKAYLCME